MIDINWLRSFRIYNFAVFDFVVSFVGIYFLAPLLSKLFRVFKLDIPRASWLYFTLPLGIIFHIAFKTFTPLTKYLLDPQQGIVIKVVIFLLLILALRGIKIIKK